MALMKSENITNLKMGISKTCYKFDNKLLVIKSSIP